MLKKMILFSFAFIFAVAAEAMSQESQEDSPFDIGNQVYAIDDSPSLLPFTFGRVGEVIGLNDEEVEEETITTVTVDFNIDNDDTQIDDIQIYDSDDLYIPEGCLFTITGRHVCVSEHASININLSSLYGDIHISFVGPVSSRVLAINKSKRSIMVQFTTPNRLNGNRPVVYSVDVVP